MTKAFWRCVLHDWAIIISILNIIMNCAFMITSDSVDWSVNVHSTAGFQLCSVGERNRQKCSLLFVAGHASVLVA